MSRSSLAVACLATSGLLYAASMVLPVSLRAEGGWPGWRGFDSVVHSGLPAPDLPPHLGYEVFAWGAWEAPGCMFGGWVWYPNPLVWLGWILALARRPLAAFGMAVAATGIGLMAGHEFLAMTRGAFGLMSGYWAWMASMSALAGAALSAGLNRSG